MNPDVTVSNLHIVFCTVQIHFTISNCFNQIFLTVFVGFTQYQYEIIIILNKKLIFVFFKKQKTAKESNNMTNNDFFIFICCFSKIYGANHIKSQNKVDILNTSSIAKSYNPDDSDEV